MNLAGQRADVGAAMAADFGFIAHAAERQAHELASGGLGDRHAERSFADAGSADEAQDGTLGIFDQPAHRQEFEDALLDLFEAVVIAFEHLLGESQIADFLGFLLPWHRQQPVEVIARDRRFGRHRRHLLQALQFRHGLFVRVLGHAGGFDFLLELVELALLAAAQFLLDGLDLLVEVILFLRLLHLALHAALDGAVDAQLLDFDVQHLGDARQPVDGIEDFEQLLLFFDGELQVRAHGVGQFAGIVAADGRDDGVVVDVLADLGVLLEQVGDARGQRIQLRPCFDFELESLDGGFEVAFVFAMTERTLPRSTPSTSTLMLPSDCFRLCTILATVPTEKISSGRGSSTLASCCVARKIFLSPASASSSARTLDSRPTTNGVIMCGKITTSRMGIIGKRRVSDFSLEVIML